MKKFIIRLDAGRKVGFGHAMRSVCLAKYLRKHHGIETLFYSNCYEKLKSIYHRYEFQYVMENGFSEVELLYKIKDDNPGSVLFIDKLYPYTKETIRRLRDCLKIIMFHNECEGMFESDFAIFPCAHLSDQLIDDERWSYAPVKFLYGPEYVIINEEIKSFYEYSRTKNAESYITITTGASDRDGMLLQVLEWVNKSTITAKIKALYGFDFYHMTALKSLIPRLKPTIEVKEFNYTDLLSSDLAVSAIGVTTYELIFANIPVITIGHILKNAIAGEILQRRYGCNYHLGLFKELTKERFILAIRHLLDSAVTVNGIRRNQGHLVDGKGIDRLSEIIAELCATEREVDQRNIGGNA